MAAILPNPAAMHLELNARLLVEISVSSYGFAISGPALACIHAIIRDGVQRMSSRGHLNNVSKIFEAQTNLLKFVHQVIRNVRASTADEVEEQHIEDTQSSFCPVYPFT